MKTTKLEKLNACSSALRWVSEQKNQQQAWDDCKRGDWMLWLLGRLSGEPESNKRQKLVLTACECARLSLHLVEDGEDRPRIAIETAEKWTRGKATIDEVGKAAADAAAADAAAAYAAASAYAAAAVDAAAYAAYAAAAVDAVDSAAYAAYAVDAAVDAAAYAAAAAAVMRTTTLQQCADIVRKHYPKVPRL
jgi:hypothetical protein